MPGWRTSSGETSTGPWWSSRSIGPQTLPDVIVYDLAGAENDLEELRHLVSSGCPVVVLRLSDATRPHGDGAGPRGHPRRRMDVAGAELIEVVERAAAGQRSLVRLRPELRHGTRARLRSGLTERELAVLELIAAGLSNDEIAATLFITINTVKSYVRTAYKRIGAETRSQAVIWALENGLGPRHRGRAARETHRLSPVPPSERGRLNRTVRAVPATGLSLWVPRPHD